MQYKTIVLELLAEQCPTFQRRLQAERILLKAVETYASILKANHEAWTDRLADARPWTMRSQIAFDALEPAITELRADLPSELRLTDDPEAPRSLDAAMAFIRNHTPPA
jgi:hypothetical protein